MDALQIEKIKTKIYEIRGQKVILDADLAVLYGVETKYLVRQYKRNIERFPENYAFQLTNDEFLRCQNVTSKKEGRGGRRYMPYAFTEHGTIMTSSILNTKEAIRINQIIVDVFVGLRNQIAAKPEYDLLKEYMKRIEAEVKETKATQLVESNLLTGQMTKLSQKVRDFEDILDKFQNENLIIKRPEDGLDQDRLN